MKKTILLIVAIGIIFSGLSLLTYAESDFIDINDHWGKEYIEYLTGHKYSKGYTDGTFRPDNIIKVDEFITFCIRSLPNVKVDENSKNTYWASPYIQKALELEIITQNDFINFERAITREEMAYIAIQTLKLNEVVHNQLGSSIMQGINDYYLVEDFYKQNVLEVYATGLMTGKPNNIFDPKNFATRAEASVVIMRLKEVETRKPVIFDVPSTTAYYVAWTDLGWKEVPITLYAPLDKEGNVHREAVDIYEHYHEALEDESNYVRNIYNPHSLVTAVNFYPNADYRTMNELDQAYEKDWSLDVDLQVGYISNPYRFNFWDGSLSSQEYKILYGKHLDYLSTYFFEEDAQMIKERIYVYLDKVHSGDTTLKTESYELKNGRTVRLGSDTGFIVTISLKKQGD